MAELTPERLREIRERWARMPAPPWHARWGALKVYVYSDDDELGFSLQSMHPRDGYEVPAEAWGETLARAPIHVRDLLAEVERLRAEVDRCELALSLADRRMRVWADSSVIATVLGMTMAEYKPWYHERVQRAWGQFAAEIERRELAEQARRAAELAERKGAQHAD